MLISNKEDKTIWREAIRLRANEDGSYNHDHVLIIVDRKRKQLMEEKLLDKHRRDVAHKSI